MVFIIDMVNMVKSLSTSFYNPFTWNTKMQIIEACLISLITSIISFGLPLLRKCSQCPEADPDSGIECPRPPGTYGNYVNVRVY